MCGYFGNLHECPVVIDLMNKIGIALPYPFQRSYQRRMVHCLVTSQENDYSMSDAVWWFAMKHKEGKLVPNEKYTSFNARDLDKPLWREATKTSRGLMFATELGESQGKSRYLMKSKTGFALGCLYKDWLTPDGEAARSFAVITRPATPGFAKFHKKAMPLFLPMDITVIEEWLAPDIDTSPLIEKILQSSRLYCDLEITPLKSYKHSEPVGETELLEAGQQ